MKYALDFGAIETLLISDHLFRAKNTAVRKQYVQFSEQAEKAGTKVIIFGSMSHTGQRLKEMTGVAAILKYSLPGLDDIDEEDEGNSDKDSDEISFSSEDSNNEKSSYAKSS